MICSQSLSAVEGFWNKSVWQRTTDRQVVWTMITGNTNWNLICWVITIQNQLQGTSALFEWSLSEFIPLKLVHWPFSL